MREVLERQGASEAVKLSPFAPLYPHAEARRAAHDSLVQIVTLEKLSLSLMDRDDHPYAFDVLHALLVELDGGACRHCPSC